MKVIDDHLLNIISQRASADDRLRKNYNLHQDLGESVQRLLNALEPGTQLPVHRHRHTDETYIILRGRLHVKTYNDQGDISNFIVLDPREGKYGVSIAANEWHAVEVVEKGTVIFEVKNGPYRPLSDDDVMEVKE
jgi:cupin fold WbuC family metalloprotein